MSTFNNNKGNNSNNTNNTKKARAAAGTSAKKVFHRPTAKQVEKMVDARIRKGDIPLPPEKILYLAKASEAERESALKAFVACGGGSTPPTPPSTPVTPVNPKSPNPLAVAIGKMKVSTILLAIDVGYHRDPRMYHSDNRQKFITEHFDANKMDPLKVNFRNNILWVVDGGRRLLAAIDHGETEVEIQLVNESWTREEEADVYKDQDKNRIHVTAYQQYVAGLVSKNPTARQLLAITEQYGLSVCDRSFEFARPFRAVAAALKILDSKFGKVTGKYTFSWMLSIMEAANWFEDRTFLRGAVSTVFLNAFANVMVEADKAGKISAYTTNLQKTLVQLSPQLVRAYGRVQYPLMSAQGSTTTILKEIGRGVLKATDILKVVNL